MIKFFRIILLFFALSILANIITHAFAKRSMKESIDRIEEISKEKSNQAIRAINSIKRASNTLSKANLVKYIDKPFEVEKIKYVDKPVFEIQKVCKPCQICPSPKKQFLTHLGVGLLGAAVGLISKKPRIQKKETVVIRHPDIIPPTPTTTIPDRMCEDEKGNPIKCP